MQSESKLPNDSKHGSRLKTVTYLVTLPILGVILTLVFQQYFFTKNKRVEESIKIQAEYVKLNLSILNRIKKFQELSELSGTFTIIMKYVDSTDVQFAYDSIGFVIDLPMIASDTSKMNVWLDIYKDIKDNESKLDRDLFNSCENLFLYLKQNPFPKDIESYEEFEFSGWNDQQVAGRWKTLILILETRIDRRLLLIKENNGLEF